MSKLLFCTATDHTRAEKILTQLRDNRIDPQHISAVFPEHPDLKKLVLERHSKAPEGAATGGGTGGVVGGILGWLVGIGSLAIPGVGPFIAAGPILAALSGGAIGAAVGGAIGGLVGLGITEVEAKDYEAKLKEGNILISVQVDTADQEKTVREIFSKNEGENIRQSKELAAA